MAEQFKQRDVQVDWVFSGRDPQGYFDMEIFADYQTFKGLTFAVEKGKVNYLKTLWKSDLKQVWRDIRRIDVRPYDLVINDFEPITAWAAKLSGRKVVGISHQCAFNYSVPRKNMGLGVRAFMRAFAPVTLPIGLHWHHFDQPILPPMVDLHVPIIKPSEKRILVYLPFVTDTRVLDILLQVPEYQFDVYLGAQLSVAKENVRFHPFSRSGFQQHLAACEGVVCSAGFELPSETLHLGKRLLVIPIRGQAEQESNAQALRHLGIADAADELTLEMLRDWVNKAPPRPTNYPNVAESLVDWLLAPNPIPLENLADTLWQQAAKP